MKRYMLTPAGVLLLSLAVLPSGPLSAATDDAEAANTNMNENPNPTPNPTSTPDRTSNTNGTNSTDNGTFNNPPRSSRGGSSGAHGQIRNVPTGSSQENTLPSDNSSGVGQGVNGTSGPGSTSGGTSGTSGGTGTVTGGASGAGGGGGGR